MEPIIQQDPTGCGIACVAMLAGVSYAIVKTVAETHGIRIDNPALWSDPAQVRSLLRHYGILAAAETPFTGWEQLPETALLATKWQLHQGIPHWHWSVFTRSAGQPLVLDPKADLKQHRRRDFGRIRPKWFIAIAGQP
jgi:hypothetical protein